MSFIYSSIFIHSILARGSLYYLASNHYQLRLCVICKIPAHK